LHLLLAEAAAVLADLAQLHNLGVVRSLLERLQMAPTELTVERVATLMVEVPEPVAVAGREESLVQLLVPQVGSVVDIAVLPVQIFCGALPHRQWIQPFLLMAQDL
jgi:hypothetical protein